MTSTIRVALERLVELHNVDGAWGMHWDDAIAAARAALAAEPVGEGPSEYEWKDIGDGRPVQVQRCHKCGVCPSNVDDCGCFGDSRCPYFGIDAMAAPPAPEAGSATALATWLRKHSGQCVELGRPDWAHMADRSADTLEAFSRAEAEK